MKLRHVSTQIVPTFVIEDDEGNLSPTAGPVQPVTVAAKDTSTIPSLIEAGRAQLEAQIAAGDPASSRVPD